MTTVAPNWHVISGDRSVSPTGGHTATKTNGPTTAERPDGIGGICADPAYLSRARPTLRPCARTFSS